MALQGRFAYKVPRLRKGDGGLQEPHTAAAQGGRQSVEASKKMTIVPVFSISQIFVTAVGVTYSDVTARPSTRVAGGGYFPPVLRGAPGKALLELSRITSGH